MEEERVVDEVEVMEAEAAALPNGNACTCWFATKGPDANS